jgi:hypothetical protein
MTTAAELLTRLRDASDQGPSARLATLLVEDALSRPVRDLVDPGRAAQALQEGLLAWTASDAGVAQVVAEVERLRARASAHGQPVSSIVPQAVQQTARGIAKLPMVPGRDAVMKLLDRPSFRQVIRGQLIETLAEFGRKATSPVADNPIARGLGGLGKLAGQIAKPSGLGAIASAVSSEVERHVEKRATDFADNAVGGIIAGIAEQASDPGRAAQQAALRVELLDGILALTGKDVGELARGSVDEQVSLVRKGLTDWGKDGGLGRDAEALIRLALEREGERPLGAVLGALGVLEPVSRHACAYVRAALARVVSAEPFAAWLEAAMK